MELNKIINSEVLIAYFQCPRKAFLLLYTQEKGINQEYLQIIQKNKNLNQKKYIKAFKEKNNDVQLATVDHLKQGFRAYFTDFLVTIIELIFQFEIKATARDRTV